MAETRRYHIHLQSHQLVCKTCGLEFTNCQLRKFHERTHKAGSFYCPFQQSKGCKYVGRSQKSIETHVRYKHTSATCEHCGKGFKNIKSLTLHTEVFHLPNRPKQFSCHLCGRAYRQVFFCVFGPQLVAKFWPNSAKFLSNSAKFWPNSAKTSLLLKINFHDILCCN